MSRVDAAFTDNVFNLASKGDLAALQTALEGLPRGVSVSSLRGAMGNTLLHRSYGFKHTHCARWLLEFEPALIECIYECEDYRGETVLHMEVKQGNVEEVDFLATLSPSLVNGACFPTLITIQF